MNQEIKTRWVAALRSGEYRQGRGVLKKQYGNNDKPAYCCLGVLCDLAVQDGLDVTVKDSDWAGEDNDVVEFDDNFEILPDSVKNWAGLDSNNPDITLYSGEEEHEYTDNLADFNDNGNTFEEIADLIEQQL